MLTAVSRTPGPHGRRRVKQRPGATAVAEGVRRVTVQGVPILSTVESGFLRVHQAIYEATRGAVGHRLIGIPTLLLTTTGRRTGLPRTAALVYAKDDDGSLVVAASNGGADRPPGWLHNVKADRSVEIQIGRRGFDGTAEAIGPGDPEYGRLWALVNRNARRRYERYQQRTDRPIELVTLRHR